MTFAFNRTIALFGRLVLIQGSLLCVLYASITGPAHADEKADALTKRSTSPETNPANQGARYRVPELGNSRGDRTVITNQDVSFPVAVVRGTPYQMGWHLGRLMKDEMHAFIPAALKGIMAELSIDEKGLVDVWNRTAAYTDDRLEQELTGLADGSGIPLGTLQAIHAVPLLMPYSCSSIAVWGEATEDGHLYQTRNLDWSLEVGAHEFPVIVVYVPDGGHAHVVPTFAGMVGAHTGMNVKGTVLSEMGDASGKESPYFVHAPHFTTFFRTMLYDSDSLSETLDIFNSLTPTKRYHFVFGDGQKETRAVKIRAHSPEKPEDRIAIWKDNDPTDEFAPFVQTCTVYNDEGRGAFPTLKSQYGKLNGPKLIELANEIPIKGGNVEIVVYDATDLRLWVSYAKGQQEAYQRPYAFLDLKNLDVDGDGKTDIQ